MDGKKDEKRKVFSKENINGTGKEIKERGLERRRMKENAKNCNEGEEKRNCKKRMRKKRKYQVQKGKKRGQDREREREK